MHVHRIQFAFASLLVLVGSIFDPTVATAQYNMQQCAGLLNQLSEYKKENSFKEMIPLARQLASYCKDEEDYAIALEALATGLNGDSQHEEALAVADRCLQTNNADVLLLCMQDRANALYGLGRVQEAKTTIERALRQPAITEWDAAAKQQLRMFLAEVNATLNNQQPPPVPNAQPAAGPSNAITKLPGGVKCIDLFNKNQLVCFLDIEIGIITSKTPEDVRYLIDHRELLLAKDFGLYGYARQPGRKLAGCNGNRQACPRAKVACRHRLIRQMRERLRLCVGWSYPAQDQGCRWHSPALFHNSRKC